MKKRITFESAALAMLKSTLIEHLEIEAFNPDSIYARDSIFRQKLRLIPVKFVVSPTKYGVIESKKGSQQTIGGAYVDFPTPGRKNHCKDICVTVNVEIDAVSETELRKEFDSLDDISELQESVDAAISSVEGRITAVCRIEIIKFGNVWSPVSATVDIDGRKEWDDFLSGYDTFDCSLPRAAKIDERNPEFCDDFKELLSL